MIDELLPEDVEILNDLLYSFPYPEQDLCIEYSTLDKEWYAYHNDEELWEEKVILENKDFDFSDDIMLFNVYNLSIEEFNIMKDFVQKDILSNSTNSI